MSDMSASESDNIGRVGVGGALKCCLPSMVSSNSHPLV
jgi:hypothetical protein